MFSVAYRRIGLFNAVRNEPVRSSGGASNDFPKKAEYWFVEMIRCTVADTGLRFSPRLGYREASV